jgi:hypothetical protein
MKNGKWDNLELRKTCEPRRGLATNYANCTNGVQGMGLPQMAQIYTEGVLTFDLFRILGLSPVSLASTFVRRFLAPLRCVPPNSAGYPSSAAAHGQGDFYYTSQAFCSNQLLNQFFMLEL